MSLGMGAAKFRNILVPVDGSHYAEKAGLTAVDLAKKYSAKLMILYVAKYPPNSLGVSSTHTVSVGFPLGDPLADKAKQQATDSIDKISEYASKCGVNAEEQIVDTSSSIVETIADYAYRNNIDLIVMGNRGLTPFQELLVGSVAEGVLRQARCTVMVVK